MNVGRGHTELTCQRAHGICTGFVPVSDFDDLRRYEFGASASSQILGASDWLQVVGVNAACISAEMIQLHPCGDGSAVAFVDKTMRPGGATTRELDHPVTLTVDAALPIPASRLFVHEIFDGRETAMVTDNKLLELTLDDTFAGLSAISAGHGCAASTHAQPGWVWWGQVDGDAGAATYGIRATERPAAINTGFVTVGAHSRDLQVRSFGVTPTDVRASRGHFVA
jgi:hypothetical protein